jgi:hypothetical protein
MPEWRKFAQSNFRKCHSATNRLGWNPDWPPHGSCCRSSFSLHTPEFMRCIGADAACRLWYDQCLPSDLSADWSTEALAKVEAQRRRKRVARRRALFEMVNAASRTAADVPRGRWRAPNADKAQTQKSLGAKFRMTPHASAMSAWLRVIGWTEMLWVQCFSAPATQTGRRQRKVCAEVRHDTARIGDVCVAPRDRVDGSVVGPMR